MPRRKSAQLTDVDREWAESHIGVDVTFLEDDNVTSGVIQSYKIEGSNVTFQVDTDDGLIDVELGTPPSVRDAESAAADESFNQELREWAKAVEAEKNDAE